MRVSGRDLESRLLELRLRLLPFTVLGGIVLTPGTLARPVVALLEFQRGLHHLRRLLPGKPD
ncbi:hypothetical protein DX914_00200 [Lysobacter silvisoli]|uniref:Uncharacterized protein n=1 Tax=Lysobacter silvisoli TaxID=2293254 RepID=A0A371K193_9GAMM|nr:hypothetical protein DX914_00200 [Lysobacter silvisoli]